MNYNFGTKLLQSHGNKIFVQLSLFKTPVILCNSQSN